MSSESIALHIAGMHCAGCVSRVERALARVPGLLKAEVLLTEQRAQLQLQPGWQAAHLVQALTEAGYQAPLSQATLRVEGLNEAAQLPRLEAALQAVPGVLTVAVNLAQGSVRLQALPSTPAAALRDAARAAGFEAALQPLAGEPADDPLAAEAARLRRDALLAGAAALPLLAPMLALPFGVHAMLPPLLQALLAGFVLLLPGARLLRAAWAGLRHRAPGMDLLVSLGAWSAFGLSLWLWLGEERSGMQLYFESAAVIVAFVLLGRWLEGRARQATGSAVRSLQQLLPAQAEVQINGQWKAIPLAELQPGQRLRVRPGQRLPCDAEVLSGRSHINLAHLNGEPLPQAVEPGAQVPAAALNLDGLLELRATHTAAGSSLGRLLRLVETAQASKPPIQRLADRVAARFVPAVLALALLTLAAWALAGQWPAGLVNAVAVLVVACPCALGLATPAAVVTGIGRAAGLGLLVRDATALEALAGVQRMAFDKTGTLTLGRPQLLAVEPVQAGANRLQLQALAAALAQASTHPLSQALRQAQGELPLPELKAAREHAGLGLEAELDGQTLLLGSSRLMAERGVSTQALERVAAAQAQQGRSVSWLAQLKPQPQLLALLAFGDAPRPDAAEALQQLQQLGLQLAVLSGDRPEAVRSLAAQLGLHEADDVHGGLLPADKLSSLHAWRARGERLAFVGDGLNDAPALAAADVGIALHAAHGDNDASRQAAALTLLQPQLTRLPQAVRLARATLRCIRQNLAWAFGFNLLMIPLAMAGQLPPMLAAAAMAASSLLVLANALRLRRWRP